MRGAPEAAGAPADADGAVVRRTPDRGGAEGGAAASDEAGRDATLGGFDVRGMATVDRTAGTGVQGVALAISTSISVENEKGTLVLCGGESVHANAQLWG